MKIKMAPNLGDEVVGEVFKAVGDSASTKRAAADAKARSSMIINTAFTET